MRREINFLVLFRILLICSSSWLWFVPVVCSRRWYSAHTRSGSDKSRLTSSQTEESKISVRSCLFQHRRWPPNR